MVIMNFKYYECHNKPNNQPHHPLKFFFFFHVQIAGRKSLQNESNYKRDLKSIKSVASRIC